MVKPDKNHAIYSAFFVPFDYWICRSEFDVDAMKGIKFLGRKIQGYKMRIFDIFYILSIRGDICTYTKRIDVRKFDEVFRIFRSFSQFYRVRDQ